MTEELQCARLLAETYASPRMVVTPVTLVATVCKAVMRDEGLLSLRLINYAKLTHNVLLSGDSHASLIALQQLQEALTDSSGMFNLMVRQRVRPQLRWSDTAIARKMDRYR